MQRHAKAYFWSSNSGSTGREPLPPSGPIRPPGPASSDDSKVMASTESIIVTQLRLEWEVAEVKRDKSNVDARLRVMESESTRLREECVTRDSRIAQLMTLVESLLARDTASPPKFSAADAPEPETAEPRTRSAPAATVPDD